MKKIIFFICIMLFSISSFAQYEVGSIHIMPKAGINIASLSETSNSDYRVGLAIGAELEYQAHSLLAVSVGATYSEQGATYYLSPYDYTFKMDYINVPLLANFYVAKGFALKVGLEGGVLINQKIKGVGNGISFEQDLEKAMSSNGKKYTMKSFIAGMPLGASYEYKNFQIDARYIIGLTNANEFVGSNDRHNLFQLTLGYKLKLK